MIDYIKIIKTELNGDILEFKTIARFNDTDEMCRYFAYSEKRYNDYLSRQHLSRCDVDECGDLRPLALIERVGRYKENWASIRILDIRNYDDIINKYRMSGNTLYCNETRKNKCQGRTHKGGYDSYKHTAFYKNSLICRYTGTDYDIEDNEDIQNCVIACTMPSDNVSRTGRDPWDENWIHLENNWKQRKIRHQWQWHKPRACGERNKNVYTETYTEEIDWKSDMEDFPYLIEDIGA